MQHGSHSQHEVNPARLLEGMSMSNVCHPLAGGQDKTWVKNIRRSTDATRANNVCSLSFLNQELLKRREQCAPYNTRYKNAIQIKNQNRLDKSR